MLIWQHHIAMLTVNNVNLAINLKRCVYGGLQPNPFPTIASQMYLGRPQIQFPLVIIQLPTV